MRRIMEITKSETLGEAVCPKPILNVLGLPWFVNGVRTASRIGQRVLMKPWALVLW